MCGVVLVKFTEDDDVPATYCRINLQIIALRKRIADHLKIPCAVVQIFQHGNDDDVQFLRVAVL